MSTTTIERLLLPIIECPPFLPPSYQEGGEEREIAEEERRYARYVGAIMQSKGGRRNNGEDDDEEEEEGGMMMDDDSDVYGRDVGNGGADGSPQKKKKKKKSVGDVVLERKIAEAEEQIKRDLVACFQEELRPPPLRKTLNNDNTLDKSINNVSMIDDASMDM